MSYNFDEIIDRNNTNCIKFDAMEAFIGAKDAIPMWVADMDIRTPDFVIEALKKRLEHEVLGYTFRSDEFYDSIINWLQKRHQWSIQKDWISFSPGVVSGYTIAVEQFSNPGDKVIIQPPVYFPFLHSIEGLGRTPLLNPLKLENGRLCMDFENLESQIDSSTKVLLLCNPHNPGGSVWTKEELTQLSEICAKNNIVVVSDEIHSDVVFQPNKYTPYASISKAASMNSITVLSHSKTFNVAGLATSYVIAENKALLEKYNKSLNMLHLNMGNIFGAEALVASYKNGEKWLTELINYLEGNVNLVEEFISQNLPQLKVIRPESTFLVWIDCREMKMNAAEIKDFFFNKAKIAINEGSMFGIGGEGFVRLNIGCPRSVVQKALDQLKEAFNA
ncbi:MAG: PatB family C-S lyase [Salinivirgaceae bacterium]|nr:PatB family C-S lyase [Salinivirgaceae bacterium]MDD4746785.1 PatB family C-S lyase [Salinivirgaceae bacterium]